METKNNETQEHIIEPLSSIDNTILKKRPIGQNLKPPTLRQKKALQLTREALENIGTTRMNKGMILRKAGYPESIIKNPQVVFNSAYFQEALNEIDDRRILNQIEDIAFSDDKRVSLDACKEVMKLKSRYPATSLRINDFRDEINDLLE